MKKLLAVAAIILALGAAYIFGHHSGKTYAITHSEMWLLEMPEEDTVTINIDLDGEWYERSAWIG